MIRVNDFFHRDGKTWRGGHTKESLEGLLAPLTRSYLDYHIASTKYNPPIPHERLQSSHLFSIPLDYILPSTHLLCQHYHGP